MCLPQSIQLCFSFLINTNEWLRRKSGFGCFVFFRCFRHDHDRRRISARIQPNLDLTQVSFFSLLLFSRATNYNRSTFMRSMDNEIFYCTIMIASLYFTPGLISTLPQAIFNFISFHLLWRLAFQPLKLYYQLAKFIQTR